MQVWALDTNRQWNSLIGLAEARCMLYHRGACKAGLELEFHHTCTSSALPTNLSAAFMLS